MILKISHIAIVVPKLDEALSFWVDTLGLPLEYVEHVPDHDVDVAFLPSGESEIELLEPIGSDSGVAKFLERRGPGLHHICFEVDDIEATLERVREAGVELINETPTIGTGGKKIAFIHPKDTGGVLVELYEITPEETARRRERLKDMRRRLRQRRRVFSAGITSFFSSLRIPGNGQNKNSDSGKDEPPSH